MCYQEVSRCIKLSNVLFGVMCRVQDRNGGKISSNFLAEAQQRGAIKDRRCQEKQSNHIESESFVSSARSEIPIPKVVLVWLRDVARYFSNINTR